MPDNLLLLVDTFNTLEGVKNAITVAKKYPNKFLGIRLDSGDLAALSIKARELLDAAGFKNAIIVGSSDLDEDKINDYKKRGAVINPWGVGTRLCTAYDEPALHIAYKLGAIRKPGEGWQYKQKVSDDTHKISLPGILNIARYVDKDVVYNEESTHNKQGLLTPIFRQGKLIYQSPPLAVIRERSQQERLRFTSAVDHPVLLPA